MNAKQKYICFLILLPVFLITLDEINAGSTRSTPKPSHNRGSGRNTPKPGGSHKEPSSYTTVRSEDDESRDGSDELTTSEINHQQQQNAEAFFADLGLANFIKTKGKLFKYNKKDFKFFWSKVECHEKTLSCVNGFCIQATKSKGLVNYSIKLDRDVCHCLDDYYGITLRTK